MDRYWGITPGLALALGTNCNFPLSLQQEKGATGEGMVESPSNYSFVVANDRDRRNSKFIVVRVPNKEEEEEDEDGSSSSSDESDDESDKEA